MKRRDGCFLRGSNCTGLPCSETAPVPVECSLFDAAEPANACTVHTRCLGQYKEGCLVGRREQKLQLAIPVACAEALLRAGSCADAQATFAKPFCR